MDLTQCKRITNIDDVQGILGSPKPNLHKKIYNHLNGQMQQFIRHAPLLFISTVDESGFPTISPKGDGPGFVMIEDKQHLLIPERKGNKLAVTFRNILNGSKMGLLLVVPGTNEVLRVQGSAELLADDALNQTLASQSQDALLVTRVSIDHCYFHCGKAFLRSQLFSDTLEKTDMKISFGAELAGNSGLEPEGIQGFDEGVKTRYETDL